MAYHMRQRRLDCKPMVKERLKKITRDGKLVRDFRGTWDSLVKAAGLPGLLLHDFRRSAVRNMIRRGVPQETAREISGQKTDAVFSRYNIVIMSKADIADAARHHA